MGMSLGLSRYWGVYENSLRKFPIRTQMLTTGALWALGDCIAQNAEGKKAFDKRRLALTGLYGAVLIGPTGHNWYQGLDRAVVHYFRRNSAAFITAKVAADTFIYTPFNVALFFAFMTVVEGGAWQEVKEKVQRDFVSTMIAEIVVWPAYQALNFARVPLQHQLLFCNFGTLFDSAFLCWVRSQDEDWVQKLLRDVRSSHLLGGRHSANPLILALPLHQAKVH